MDCSFNFNKCLEIFPIFQGRAKFDLVCVSSLQKAVQFCTKSLHAAMEWQRTRPMSTLKVTQNLTKLTTTSTNIIKSGKGPFLSGTSEKV